MSLTDNVAKDRGRLARPDRINIGEDELMRNDLIAKEQGTSERTVNRGDAHGAPFTYVGGSKYRPIKNPPVLDKPHSAQGPAAAAEATDVKCARRA